MATASDDEYVRIYNCVEGKMEAKVGCKKYGCSLVRFTHDNSSVMHASKNSMDGEALAEPKFASARDAQ